MSINENQDNAPQSATEAMKVAAGACMERFDIRAAQAAVQEALRQHPDDVVLLGEAANVDALSANYPAFVDRVLAFEARSGQRHEMHRAMEIARAAALPDLRAAAETVNEYLRENVPVSANMMTAIALRKGGIKTIYSLMLDPATVATHNEALADRLAPVLGAYAGTVHFACTVADEYKTAQLAKAAAALTILKLKAGSLLAGARHDVGTD